MSVLETPRRVVGTWIGAMLAPVARAVSAARHARTFHPDGTSFVARVNACPMKDLDSGLARIGHLLEGPALARFSGALWRRGFQHLDVLGVALRFGHENGDSADATSGDQDLLFATIVSPFTMPFSPFTTDAGDFTNNRYWAVSPFEVRGAGYVKFRLSPKHHEPPVTSAVRSLPRENHLAALLGTPRVVFDLEVRRTLTLGWATVAKLTLERVAEVDQEALRFSPFNNGRGIEPRGLVHAIRPAVYRASQSARPDHASAPDHLWRGKVV